MSVTFQFTMDDSVGEEIKQHIYGKFGCAPSKALGEMVLAQMSKNPLTVQQFNRIVKRYGPGTVISPEPLAVPLKGEK